MWMVGLGVVLLLLKLLGVVPVAHWSWIVILLPFGLAALWWAWADSSGYTQRKAMEAMDAKKAARRQRAVENLGQSDRQRRS
ncbi:TIGR04438 family Trp-rich protein [Paucibacter sp. APW11]|uniref:TIGR04438 family Trp-rich protein n=1 Tax=Roseateles aquae TaxID=3077235 RepID=A0ABU3PA10_9BURK|nr:TIGR04438 family Trp-rich protein [Paucibacter sp. APW11]MDT8999060.1 TIGR04438 family Trp-rich protein [Paucibacter sp. APW11]